MKVAPLRFAVLASLATLAGCAIEQPLPSDNAYCAQLFDQFDTYEFLPLPAGGFNFRQMQLSSIRQARCVTFPSDLIGIEALGESLPPREVASDPAFPRSVAVQAGVVTNPADAVRASGFFARQGYRSRSVGSEGLGIRVYVEARTVGDVERIVALAQQAGFVGPYPSRYVLF